MGKSYRYIASNQIRFHQFLHLRPRRIAHHRFLYVESGYGEFSISGHKFDIKSNWLGLLAPGLRENCYFDREPVSYLFVEFATARPFTADKALEFEGEDPHRSTLISLLKSINAQRADPDGCFLTAAVRLMFPEQHTPEELQVDERLRKVLRLIQQSPDCNHTVSELADKAGLSETHLRRLFRTQLGVSPKQYLRRARMEFAQRLIKHEGLRVGEAAHLLGFSSVFQFSAQYRQVIGHPPSADRGTG